MRLKRLYKVMSLLISTFMLMALLAGCKSSTTEIQEGRKTSIPINALTPSPASVVEEEPLKFSVAMSAGLNPYVLQQKDINKEKWVTEVNKRYNVEITFRLLDHQRLREEIQVMFASGDIPDIVRMFDNYTRPEMANSVENGIFMALDDIIAETRGEFTSLFDMIPEAAWDENKYEGKIYGIPNQYLSSTTRRGTYIRKDILDLVNMKAPIDLDEVVEVLKVFKEVGIEYPTAGREALMVFIILLGI